jgi:dephospho-CoA kinase
MLILRKASPRGDGRTMPAIGITGGISTGKSTFCECLREIVPAAKFFDADLAARSVAELPEVKQEILGQFGGQVFSPDGDLNRMKLRAIVFADAAKRRALEQILHPRIRRQWMAEAKKHRNSPDFFFADIPLLYETGGETLCERVVVVACSRKVQLNRLAERKSLEGSEAEQMINSQMPLEEKIKRADHVVWNNGDHATLLEQAKELVALWQDQSWKKS